MVSELGPLVNFILFNFAVYSYFVMLQLLLSNLKHHMYKGNFKEIESAFLWAWELILVRMSHLVTTDSTVASHDSSHIPGGVFRCILIVRPPALPFPASMPLPDLKAFCAHTILNLCQSLLLIAPFPPPSCYQTCLPKILPSAWHPYLGAGKSPRPLTTSLSSSLWFPRAWVFSPPQAAQPLPPWVSWPPSHHAPHFHAGGAQPQSWLAPALGSSPTSSPLLTLPEQQHSGGTPEHPPKRRSRACAHKDS